MRKLILCIGVVFVLVQNTHSRTGCEFIGSKVNQIIKSNSRINSQCSDYGKAYNRASKTSSTFEENNRAWLQQIKKCKNSSCISTNFDIIVTDFKTQRESFVEGGTSRSKTQKEVNEESNFDYSVLLTILYNLVGFGALGGVTWGIIKNPTKLKSYVNALKVFGKTYLKVQSGFTAIEMIENYIMWVYRIVLVPYLRIIVILYVLFSVATTFILAYLASLVHLASGPFVFGLCFIWFSFYAAGSFGMFYQVNKLQKRFDEMQ